VHETRDVIWLKCMFYEKPVTTPEVIVIPSEDVEEPGIKAGEGDGQLNDAKADEAKAYEDEDVGNAEESVVEQESAEELLLLMMLLKIFLLLNQQCKPGRQGQAEQ